MSKTGLPPASMALSSQDARRFMLAHQQLWPPRKLAGKDGVMRFFQQVGAVQFDPINRVGRNPDLVLQSRVADYRPQILEELLYSDRQLLDGWDKVASIHPTSDWPFFGRYRASVRERHSSMPMRIPPPMEAEIRKIGPPMELAPTILETIRDRGPLSSLDLKQQERIDWHWGQPTTIARALLETLYSMGELVVHHRVGTRRAFDLAERTLPAELYSAPDPHENEEAYQEWHVLRRIGGLGLANPGSGEQWLGILGIKSAGRQRTLRRLVEQGKVVATAVEGIPGRTFFLRSQDLPTLETLQETGSSGAAIIGALDNLTWDRDMMRWIFDFDYVWEVYKPAAKRKYGYYVLPVIYGDRFVARFDPSWDRKKKLLTITDWWWEEGVKPNDEMYDALLCCFSQFIQYLDAHQIGLGNQVAEETSLHWVQKLPEFAG